MALRLLRAFARTTFGNWLSLSYLGLVTLTVLIGLGDSDGAAFGAGMLALFLSAPTSALLFTLQGMLGDWAESAPAVHCLFLFSYLFQAFVLGRIVALGRGKPGQHELPLRSGPRWQNPDHGDI
ncbi:SCO4225 family membrane protein [Streptomyces purpureus]|uniref:Uncharacterized protein n=1 Tax=Streptomyces purpureus TaxID=1951 RepID=A0A918LUE2_9ACTN|nr:hypothetical protein [Streptomyces purpureus]GGT51215.1 hypothetical protein GCM10014713_51670 [Streptomyces purpureus]